MMGKTTDDRYSCPAVEGVFDGKQGESGQDWRSDVYYKQRLIVILAVYYLHAAALRLTRA